MAKNGLQRISLRKIWIKVLETVTEVNGHTGVADRGERCSLANTKRVCSFDDSIDAFVVGRQFDYGIRGPLRKTLTAHPLFKSVCDKFYRFICQIINCLFLLYHKVSEFFLRFNNLLGCCNEPPLIRNSNSFSCINFAA